MKVICEITISAAIVRILHLLQGILKMYIKGGDKRNIKDDSINRGLTLRSIVLSTQSGVMG